MGQKPLPLPANGVLVEKIHFLPIFGSKMPLSQKLGVCLRLAKFLDNEAFQKPKIRQKSGFLPLHFNWQEMAMVFDPNFGKNMNN